MDSIYSLYHNLINVKVKAGQSVNTKEIIGTVFTDDNTKETILYFQIWKETERRIRNYGWLLYKLKIFLII